MVASPQSSDLRVSVIVVSFNTVGHLRDCLDSLSGAFEVIVVDNASNDGSADMVAKEFPGVALIRNAENRGFGAANNQGLEVMTGDLALLLNSDARLTKDQIADLAQQFGVPGIIAVGPSQISDHGKFIPAAANQLTQWSVFCEQTLLEKLFPFWPFSSYWIPPSVTEACDVEQVMGACLMFRPVEQFDERFFLYCEDTELCRRLRDHGRIRYVPEVKCRHSLGASSKSDRWLSVARYNRGKELYFQIHHGRVAMILCWAMNRMGALLRLMIWGIPMILTLGLVRRFQSQVGLFARVLTAPLTGPARPTGKH